MGSHLPATTKEPNQPTQTTLNKANLEEPTYPRPLSRTPTTKTNMQFPAIPSFAPPPAHKRVYSVIPLVLTIVSFSLITILIQIGTTPTNYTDYPIISLDTSGLRQKYATASRPGLPIHDIYNVYLRTHCEGYFWNNAKEVVGLECSKPAGTG